MGRELPDLAVYYELDEMSSCSWPPIAFVLYIKIETVIPEVEEVRESLRLVAYICFVPQA